MASRQSPTARIHKVKEHFESEADEFDSRVIKIVPHYADMIDALVTTLPFSASRPIRVADLGCGTGTISLSVKKRFPNARITCIDMSENMLALAARKLKVLKHIEFEPGELSSYRFTGRYDAIVSSLALHHIEGPGKIALFKKIHGTLKAGGVFANADIIASADKSIQQKFIDKWGEFVMRSFTQAQTHENHRRYKREDRPAVLADELKNLKTAKFRSTEIFWKYYNFVVYCARK